MVQTAYQNALLELDNLEQTLNDARRAKHVQEEEARQLDEALLEMPSRIAKDEEKIEVLKKELAKARIYRQHQEEYEVLTQCILKYPSREELQKRKDELMKTKKKIDISRRRREKKILAQKSAYALFFEQLAMLQESEGKDEVSDSEEEDASAAMQLEE